MKNILFILLMSFLVITGCNKQKTAYEREYDKIRDVKAGPAPVADLPSKGSESERDAIASYIRHTENDSDERLVLVLNSGSELKVVFTKALIEYAPDQFISRHRSDFQKLQDVGFEILTIEANTSDGRSSEKSYRIADLKR